MRTSRVKADGDRVGEGAWPRRASPPPPRILAGGASRAKAAGMLVAWRGFEVEDNGLWVVLSCLGAPWFHNFVVFHSIECTLSLRVKVYSLS